MNPVILISSCGKDKQRGCHEAINATWGRDAAIPYFLLLGEGCGGQGNEVVLSVGDDYNSLPYKTREGHRWARQKGYDFIFQGFVDTYCFTKRMLVSGFEKFDYVGHFRGEDHLPQLGQVCIGCYPSGGSGYWMSPRATDLMLLEEPDHWAEDLWVGRVMKQHGITGTQDYRYFSAGGYSDTCLTSHLSQGTNHYEPKWMGYIHRLGLGR